MKSLRISPHSAGDAAHKDLVNQLNRILGQLQDELANGAKSVQQVAQGVASVGSTLNTLTSVGLTPSVVTSLIASIQGNG